MKPTGKPYTYRHKITDLTRKRFGRLTAQWPVGQNTQRRVFWLCLCKCGRMPMIPSSSLINGNTQSCGCLQVDVVSTHHQSHIPEYDVWAGMIQRCTNPKDKAFKNYGGRGIEVCKRWRNFENFIADMGKRPNPKLTIERVNNDKGYSPKNCKWATRTEQNRNQRPRKH